MKTKHIVISIVVIAVAVLAALPSFAWQSVRVGQKNFERGWSAYSFKRYDKANEYFATSADAFAEALKEYPPSRTLMFPSNLTMAGISFYFAGRDQECIDVMAKAQYKEDSIMETYVFPAMAYARLGDSEQTAIWLEKFIKTYPRQRMLTEEAGKQLAAIKSGSTDMNAVADAMDAAAIRQFQFNRVNVGSNLTNPNEQCSGNFWWRNHKSPCSRGQFPTRDN